MSKQPPIKPRFYVHPDSPYRWVYSGIWSEEFVRGWHDLHDQMYHDHRPFELASRPTTQDRLRFHKRFVESIGGEAIGASGGTDREFMHWFTHGKWPWEDVRYYLQMYFQQKPKRKRNTKPSKP